MFSMLSVEMQVQIRKVRFLQKFFDSECVHYMFVMPQSLGDVYLDSV